MPGRIVALISGFFTDPGMPVRCSMIDPSIDIESVIAGSGDVGEMVQILSTSLGGTAQLVPTL